VQRVEAARRAHHAHEGAADRQRRKALIRAGLRRRSGGERPGREAPATTWLRQCSSRRAPCSQSSSTVSSSSSSPRPSAGGMGKVGGRPHQRRRRLRGARLLRRPWRDFPFAWLLRLVGDGRARRNARRRLGAEDASGRRPWSGGGSASGISPTSSTASPPRSRREEGNPGRRSLPLQRVFF